jgi:hypothetical protein
MDAGAAGASGRSGGAAAAAAAPPPSPPAVRRVWLSWSSGKDCCYALHVLRQDPSVMGTAGGGRGRAADSGAPPARRADALALARRPLRMG